MQKVSREARVVNAQVVAHWMIGVCGLVLLAGAMLLMLLLGGFFGFWIGGILSVIAVIWVTGWAFSLGVLDGIHLANSAVQSEFGLPDIFEVRRRMNRTYLEKQAAEMQWGVTQENLQVTTNVLQELVSAIDVRDDWLDPIQSVELQQSKNAALAKARTYLKTQETR